MIIWPCVTPWQHQVHNEAGSYPDLWLPVGLGTLGCSPNPHDRHHHPWRHREPCVVAAKELGLRAQLLLGDNLAGLGSCDTDRFISPDSWVFLKLFCSRFLPGGRRDDAEVPLRCAEMKLRSVFRTRNAFGAGVRVLGAAPQNKWSFIVCWEAEHSRQISIIKAICDEDVPGIPMAQGPRWTFGLWKDIVWRFGAMCVAECARPPGAAGRGGSIVSPGGETTGWQDPADPHGLNLALGS
ncbi:hypothetical protein AV530_009399 [Patagioenas fasciata monilis]|uniref:Uncharacterized protein n=1 Tax=Patagioenas fasciata monilis TaxID=372326 RepID=A0A1V4JIW0_PATFA|nr:hypothetical protein AV530_009399 [Patagioenas fasciata monilis]